MGRCRRTVFNLLPLRGRKRRTAKLCLILFLSAVLFIFGMSGMCVLDSRMCTDDGGEVLGQLRIRDPIETAQYYEVKLNPGLHRNIKGGRGVGLESELNLDLEQPNDNPEKEQTQLDLPPLLSRDDIMSRDRQSNGVNEDNNKVVRADDQMTTQSKSDDVSMEGDEAQGNADTNEVHPDIIQSQNNFEVAPETSKKQDSSPMEAAMTPNINDDDVDEKSLGGVQQYQEFEEVAVDKSEGVDVLEEGNQLLSQGDAEKEQVFTVKKTKEEAADSEPKPQVRAVPKQVEDKSSLSLEEVQRPTGVVAVNKKDKVMINEQKKKEPEKGGVASDNGAPGGGVAGDNAATVGGVASDNGARGGGVAGDNAATVGGVASDNGAPGGGVKVIPKGQSPNPKKEEKHMSAVEMAAAIESGEMCKTVCPPFTWSDWSPCSKACGRGRRYRKAMYKFICQSSELCPLNRIEESVCDTPCKFDPEKYGGPNGLDMYPINPLNPAIYPEDRDYMCGHWLVEYEKLHNEILAGRKPPRYLVYSTGKGSYPTAGGIAPRIRGITTAFFLAVLLDRAFMIEWQDPPGLEQYLEPKSFNWADLSKLEKHNRGPIRDIGSWRSSKENSISSQWYMSTNFSTYFENEVEIVQGHRYDFTYAVLRNPELMPKAFELGVDRIKCRICCAFDMLFKMTENFQKEMDTLLKSLGAPKKEIGAIQVRAKSNNVQDAVKYAESFVSCALKAGKGLKLSSPISWVPIFNNRLVVHIVRKKYGDKLKIPINIDTATRTVHTHLGNLPADTEIEVAKAVQERTFKEFFLTINSTVLIRKKGYEGSFGNIADAIRRFYHKVGSVHTFLVGNTCTKFPDTYKIE